MDRCTENARIGSKMYAMATSRMERRTGPPCRNQCADVSHDRADPCAEGGSTRTVVVLATRRRSGAPTVPREQKRLRARSGAFGGPISVLSTGPDRRVPDEAAGYRGRGAHREEAFPPGARRTPTPPSLQVDRHPATAPMVYTLSPRQRPQVAGWPVAMRPRSTRRGISDLPRVTAVSSRMRGEPAERRNRTRVRRTSPVAPSPMNRYGSDWAPNRLDRRAYRRRYRPNPRPPSRGKRTTRRPGPTVRPSPGRSPIARRPLAASSPLSAHGGMMRRGTAGHRARRRTRAGRFCRGPPSGRLYGGVGHLLDLESRGNGGHLPTWIDPPGTPRSKGSSRSGGHGTWPR